MKTPEEIGHAVLERLAVQAAANRARGNASRAEVRVLLAQDPDLTGPQLRARLSHPLSLRRVQELRKELRAESSASR
jgi:hypothetical protein